MVVERVWEWSVKECENCWSKSVRIVNDGERVRGVLVESWLYKWMILLCMATGGVVPSSKLAIITDECNHVGFGFAWLHSSVMIGTLYVGPRMLVVNPGSKELAFGVLAVE